MTRVLGAASSICVVLCFVAQFSLAAQPKQAEKPSAPLYRTIEQWPIPNQGHGRTIVTAVQKPSQAQLKAVAEQLKIETRADRLAFVWIYDDDRAARNRLAATRGALSPREETSYARHFVGQYQRNVNSGLHSLFVYPKGGNGPHIEIKY